MLDSSPDTLSLSLSECGERGESSPEHLVSRHGLLDRISTNNR